jgi:hypothetical protein
MAKRGGRSGRKYVRDSIGRFATTGATARGGRLKTKSGKKRATQTVKAKTGGKPAGAIKGKIKRDPGAAKPAARSKPTVARTSKAPTNKAKVAYKRARYDARSRNADLRGADVDERRMANSASAKLKNMQRRRSASTPKAGADAPRSKQKARELARVKRAISNERKAYAARGDGAGSAKQSRSASVAKRAKDIYSGKISASYKTTSRLTRTQNPDVLRARIKKGEKLTAARAKKKSVTANNERAAAKRRGAVGKISEAKAGRIVARMDAQRGRKALPGRRNANFARTYERSRQFILKPSTAALKKGKPISVNESVQKAVANAAKRRKPKPAAAKPAVAKVTRTGGRINAGRKADRKATLSVNKARSEERAARFDAMNKNKMAPFSSPKRQKQNQRLNDAVYEVNSRVQTRRNIRAQFPVNRKTPSLKAGKISSTIKKASATKAQKGRATANKERSLDSRGNIRGGKNRKTYRTSMKAAEFYSNPAKALKGIKKEVGYKAPRSLRKGVKQTPVKRPTVNSAKRAPDNARTRANRLKTTQAKVKYLRVEPDSSAFKSAVKQRDAALKARPAGTAGKVTFRSKARAASRFQQRANDVTGRVRMDIKYDRTKSLRATGGGGGKGARVRDTGASQTSLFGKPAPLRRASKVSVIKRRTGKRRFS